MRAAVCLYLMLYRSCDVIMVSGLVYKNLKFLLFLDQTEVYSPRIMLPGCICVNVTFYILVFRLLKLVQKACDKLWMSVYYKGKL